MNDFYGIQDANWNVTAIVDVSGVEERFAYDAYGTSVVLTPLFGSRSESDFDWETRFGEYRFDSLMAAYHARNRLFISLLGAWAQRDPAGVRSGVNLYQYVDSDPLTLIDASGLGLPPWLCKFLESDLASCVCFLVTTVDSILALAGPFIQLLEIGIVDAILKIISLLDCLCDVAGIVAEGCAGCLSLLEAIAAGMSCLIDVLSLRLTPHLDRDIFLGMIEVIAYIVTQLSAGEGLGDNLLPPGGDACGRLLG